MYLLQNPLDGEGRFHPPQLPQVLEHPGRGSAQHPKFILCKRRQKKTITREAHLVRQRIFKKNRKVYVKQQETSLLLLFQMVSSS